MTQRPNDTDTNVSLAGKGLRGRMLAATALGLALTVGIGGWAAQAKLAGAVISQGELVVTGETKQVQHVDGGTIVAIPVKIGSSVKKGEVVLRLDDTQARSQLDVSRGQWFTASAVEVKELKSGVGNALLDNAKAAGADMLVMGAYGNKRWWEMLFGGVTRTLLDSMTALTLLSR